MLNKFLTGIPYNLLLEDAFNDPETTISRRLLAGVALDTQITDGYYSTFQLYEAFKLLAADIAAGVSAEDDDSIGAAMIEHLLAGEGDDYQRRLYYLVSEKPAAEAVGDLHWLTTLLGPRAAMFKILRETGVRMSPLPGREVDIEKVGCIPFGYD